MYVYKQRNAVNGAQTHICMQLMMVPNRPTMPRNSTRLRFFTVYSWHTLETAYKVALTSTKQSPSRMFEAERADTWFHSCGSTCRYCT